MMETCQLALQSIDAAPKRISFSDKALNCLRCVEQQAFDILDRIQSVYLSGRLRCFTHDTEP
jgi:hypothetical protein